MSILEKRVAAMEAHKNTGRTAFIFVWDDDDQPTVERAIARRRAEQPDAGEIVAISWGRDAQ